IETLETFGVYIIAGDNRMPLDDCEISENLFVGLGLPVATLAPFGLLRYCANRVRQCATGFYFLSAPTGQLAGRTATATALQKATGFPSSAAMLRSVAENARKTLAKGGTLTDAIPDAPDTGSNATVAPNAPPAPAASIDSILDTLDQQIENAGLGGATPRPVL